MSRMKAKRPLASRTALERVQACCEPRPYARDRSCRLSRVSSEPSRVMLRTEMPLSTTVITGWTTAPMVEKTRVNSNLDCREWWPKL